jgi:pyruvate carboxylase
MTAFNVIRENRCLQAPAEALNEKSRLTLAASKVTGTLFCSYHQGYANADTGEFLIRNRTKKWMCERCLKIRGIVKAA